jgi:RNA polymerase subunit RPABC4/transcription elongation factor Spt4
VWFRAISLSYVTHSQNGCRGAYKARLLPPEPILRFSQRTCPIHYFMSKTHVWCGFALFHCRTSPIPKTGVVVHTKHEFLPPEPFLRFSQRTCPIHYFRSTTHVWVGFAQFHCHTSPILKTGVGCIQSMSFRHRNHFFVFRNEHAQSTTLGPKLMFGVVLCNFVAAHYQFQKWVSGCIQARVFATGTISSFCAANMLNPIL